MTKTSKGILGFICLATFAKLLLNSARRMVYPFAPEFARALSVSLPAVTSMIAVNQATALLGVVGAGFADRYGYKRLVLISVFLAALGCFAAGFIPFYPALLLCMFLTGLAKSVFDPSIQAFVSSLVPYHRRGRFIGATELSWAGATLLGIPAAGLIIQAYSVHTPFVVLFILFIACFGLTLKFMPKDPAISPRPAGTTGFLFSNFRKIGRERKVWGVLAFCFFMSLGSDVLFVVYGAWLETSYGLSPAAIGLGTVLIGLAELLGEAATAVFSDRVGLRKSIVLGSACSAAAYLLLPFTDQGLWWVLAGLFGVFFFFEFTIVTAMSLSTELVPGLRASTMSAFYAVGGLGRVAGAFLGGVIWITGGISAVSLVTGISTLAGLVCMIWVSPGDSHDAVDR